MAKNHCEIQVSIIQDKIRYFSTAGEFGSNKDPTVWLDEIRPAIPGSHSPSQESAY
jgi:hypothetical protein